MDPQNVLDHLVVVSALKTYVASAGSHENNQYQSLTSHFHGGRSVIEIIFSLFHEYLNTKKGYNVPRADLRCENWNGFIAHIINVYGVDLTPVGLATVRIDHLKLYKCRHLHYFASQGIVRHSHIRQWRIGSTIHRLADLGVRPNSTADLDKLFTLADEIGRAHV